MQLNLHPNGNWNCFLLVFGTTSKQYLKLQLIVLFNFDCCIWDYNLLVHKTDHLEADNEVVIFFLQCCSWGFHSNKILQYNVSWLMTLFKFGHHKDTIIWKFHNMENVTSCYGIINRILFRILWRYCNNTICLYGKNFLWKLYGFNWNRCIYTALFQFYSNTYKSKNCIYNYSYNEAELRENFDKFVNKVHRHLTI
jgi:hypothetical protein